MTREERNTKLKNLITCLKCEESGKECDANCHVQYEAGNMGEIIENLEAISKALEQEPCEDEYIKVPKKALKYRTAGMVAYNAEWLKNHFDIERAVICGEQEPCEDWYDVPSDEMTLEQARQAVKDLRKKLAEHLEQDPCDVFDKYGNYKYPNDVELTEPNTATSMPCEDAISRKNITAFLNGLISDDTERTKALKYVNELQSVNSQSKYCDRNICVSNEYNGIGCDECEATKNKDAISRDAVLLLIQKIKDQGQINYMSLLNLAAEVRKLSPVNPQYTEDEIQKMQDLEQAEIEKAYELGKAEGQKNEDAISRTDMLDAIGHGTTYTSGELQGIIKGLPPVNSQPKTGHWITTPQGERCSNCLEEFRSLRNYSYCPNCGRHMVKLQKSEE